MAEWKYFSEAEFIWNGEWNDSELLYKGKLYNCFAIEEQIRNEFEEFAQEENVEINEENFEAYCKENHFGIKEIFEMCGMYV